MPTERRWCAGAAVLGKVYVVGGQQDGHVLGTAERFDPETNSWEALPDMPTCREACAVASCGACLYVFGGCQHEVPLAIAERLQVAEPSAWWEGLENMPCSRDACAAAALNGRLYVMGGRSQGAFLRSADVLSASALSWSRLPSMPTARLGCSAAAGMRWVYVCGGHAGGGRALATVERFDVADYFWEAVEEMPSARLGAVSLCWQRSAELCVYVFGGHNGHGAVPVAERLCTDGDGFNLRWEVLPDMVTPTYACAGAAIAWFLVRLELAREPGMGWTREGSHQAPVTSDKHCIRGMMMLRFLAAEGRSSRPSVLLPSCCLPFAKGKAVVDTSEECQEDDVSTDASTPNEVSEADSVYCAAPANALTAASQAAPKEDWWSPAEAADSGLAVAGCLVSARLVPHNAQASALLYEDMGACQGSFVAVWLGLGRCWLVYLCSSGEELDQGALDALKLILRPVKAETDFWESPGMRHGMAPNHPTGGFLRESLKPVHPEGHPLLSTSKKAQTDDDVMTVDGAQIRGVRIDLHSNWLVKMGLHLGLQQGNCIDLLVVDWPKRAIIAPVRLTVTQMYKDQVAGMPISIPGP
ncbi:unnamed protein product [Effrenium voratum]|nr:unnamed protein product [Effrenium voratum]